MTDLITSRNEGAVTLLTLNRPDKLNALSFALIDRMMGLLDMIERDDLVRAVIVTGAGRAFSAGADIPEFAVLFDQGADRALRDFVRRGQALTARLENFPKPIIAAVNGLAYGGGCEIIEAMHLAVASEHALFAKPEINLGFPPPFGGTQRLPRLVGRKRGLEMLLTGSAIDAARALDIGLVNRVVPREALMDEALGLARAVIEKAPVAVSACLAAVARGMNLTIDEGLAVEAAQFARAVAHCRITWGRAA